MPRITLRLARFLDSANVASVGALRGLTVGSGSEHMATDRWTDCASASRGPLRRRGTRSEATDKNRVRCDDGITGLGDGAELIAQVEALDALLGHADPRGQVPQRQPPAASPLREHPILRPSRLRGPNSSREM